MKTMQTPRAVGEVAAVLLVRGRKRICQIPAAPRGAAQVPGIVAMIVLCAHIFSKCNQISLYYCPAQSPNLQCLQTTPV